MMREECHGGTLPWCWACIRPCPQLLTPSLSLVPAWLSTGTQSEQGLIIPELFVRNLTIPTVEDRLDQGPHGGILLFHLLLDSSRVLRDILGDVLLNQWGLVDLALVSVGPMHHIVQHFDELLLVRADPALPLGLWLTSGAVPRAIPAQLRLRPELAAWGHVGIIPLGVPELNALALLEDPPLIPLSLLPHLEECLPPLIRNFFINVGLCWGWGPT
mmetsp:Transcript_112184/g.194789  ORF Transcript_112184/g.194789 Transcript_112184/m.194789 type:complete len:216 (-) Transcript_112184:766-1413(-)